MNHYIAGGAADLVPSAGPYFPIIVWVSSNRAARFATLATHQNRLGSLIKQGHLSYPGPTSLLFKNFVFRSLQHKDSCHKRAATPGKVYSKQSPQSVAEYNRLNSVTN